MKTITMYQIEIAGEVIGRRFNTAQGAKCVATRLIKANPDAAKQLKIVEVLYNISKN